MKPGLAIVLGGFLAMAGCAAPALRSQSPEQQSQGDHSELLVGDVASAYGTYPLRVEWVGLVTDLPGTGSDPPPSAERSALISEMQAYGVPNPSEILATGGASLVVVSGILKPGIQKDERFDVEVHLQPGSETTSLRGGWLMETRLKETLNLGNQLREGHVLGKAQGPLLVDPTVSNERDKALLGHARVLGGGVSTKSRTLGLSLKPDKKSVQLSSQIGTAINRRFSTFSKGIKQGVATPKTDEFVELTIHPRYKDNLARYMRVIRAVAVNESESQRAQRLPGIERQLLDPVTAANAAVRLEAMGRDGVKTLLKGLQSSDSEVRFYSAEALAYLDEGAAAETLANAAREESAFRANALAALSVMTDVSAFDQLKRLLDVNSAETKYGAFRALWLMNSRDPLVRGENMNGRFTLHVIDSSGPPMVHVTRSFRPEIVLFGAGQTLETPLVLEAGSQIMVTASADDRITVSRFAPGEPDQKRVVSTKLDDVIRAIVELGGSYPDVVQALHQAKVKNFLASRFEVDALPEHGRSYERRAHALVDPSEAEHARSNPESPAAENEPGGGKTGR